MVLKRRNISRAIALTSLIYLSPEYQKSYSSNNPNYSEVEEFSEREALIESTTLIPRRMMFILKTKRKYNC